MHKNSAPGPTDALNTVVLGTGVDPACQSGLSSLRSIIPQCWDFDPAQRPSSSRILQQITTPSETEAPLGSRKDQEGETSPLASSKGEGDAAHRKKQSTSTKATAAPAKKPLQGSSSPPNRKEKGDEKEKMVDREKKVDRGKAVDRQKQQPAAPSPRPNQGGRRPPQTPAAQSPATQAGTSKDTSGKKEKPNQTDVVVKSLKAMYTNADPIARRMYRDMTKFGQNSNQISKSTQAYFRPTGLGQGAKAPKPIKPADKPKPAIKPTDKPKLANEPTDKPKPA
ncbi:hypothetical protein FS837_012724 [Tulasnella sp. UAMH 9824]|nr:hypothetical protein FS837_012724 [Tulasnella sp. UAMH 9824]